MTAEIEKNFTYHPPKEGQPEKYQRIREKAKELALLIDEECPASRERSVAMTNLETSVFWANAAIARNLAILLALLFAGSTAIAADVYVAKPLQELTERVDEHDQQICDLDERVRELEAKLAEAAAVKAELAEVESAAEPVVEPAPQPVQRDYDGAIIVPGSVRVVSRGSATVTRPAPVRTVSTSTPTSGRRLKTTAELRRDIRANRTNRVYATIEPNTRAWAITHLVNDHGYTRSQVNGLSFDDAWMLHNLAHGPKISPFTSGSSTLVAAPVETFVPTPRTPTSNPSPPKTFNPGCPNGQCPTAGQASGQVKIWFPGKRLFFGR